MYAETKTNLSGSAERRIETRDSRASFPAAVCASGYRRNLPGEGGAVLSAQTAGSSCRRTPAHCGPFTTLAAGGTRRVPRSLAPAWPVHHSRWALAWFGMCDRLRARSGKVGLLLPAVRTGRSRIVSVSFLPRPLSSRAFQPGLASEPFLRMFSYSGVAHSPRTAPREGVRPWESQRSWA